MFVCLVCASIRSPYLPLQISSVFTYCAYLEVQVSAILNVLHTKYRQPQFAAKRETDAYRMLNN